MYIVGHWKQNSPRKYFKTNLSLNVLNAHNLCVCMYVYKLKSNELCRCKRFNNKAILASFCRLSLC